jgi:hypothetical protein
MWRRFPTAKPFNPKPHREAGAAFFVLREYKTSSRKRRGAIIGDSSNGPLGTKVPAYEEAASFLLSSVSKSSVFLKLPT